MVQWVQLRKSPILLVPPVIDGLILSLGLYPLLLGISTIVLGKDRFPHIGLMPSWAWGTLFVIGGSIILFCRYMHVPSLWFFIWFGAVPFFFFSLKLITRFFAESDASVTSPITYMFVSFLYTYVAYRLYRGSRPA